MEKHLNLQTYDTHVYIYIYMYMYTRVCMYMCIHIYIHTCTCMHAYIHTYVCTHVCRYVLSMYVHILCFGNSSMPFVVHRSAIPRPSFERPPLFEGAGSHPPVDTKPYPFLV